MASLTVTLGAEIVCKKQLQDGPVKIGRSNDSDIALNNLLVSRQHARLYRERGIWFIEDTSGKNGLFVNGKQCKNCPLHNQDTIEIAKYLLTFQQSREELERGRQMAREGQRNIRTGIPECASQIPADYNSAQETTTLPTKQIKIIRQEMNKRRRPHLITENDAGQKIQALDKSKITIGKSDEADIIVPGGLTIGKIHATIREHRGTYKIEHNAGLAGLRVNDKKITKESHFLADGDSFEISDTIFRFVAGLDPHDMSRKRIV